MRVRWGIAGLRLASSCNKRTCPGRNGAIYEDAEGKTVDVRSYGRNTDHKEMAWTQEKEDFFMVLSRSMENSIARALKFFSGDVEKCILTHSGLDQIGFDGGKIE